MTLLFLKFLASSALLTALYWLALRGKATYKACRIYLLSVPALSILMSTITLEVLSADSQLIPDNIMPRITIERPSAAPLRQQTGTPAIQEPQTESTSANGVQKESPSADTGIAQYLTYGTASVSAILVLAALFYILKITKIKSRMQWEPTAEGYRMVKSPEIKTPFSFQKTIFMPASLDEGSERLIASHEKAHIAHRHYIDVLLSEFATRILWFNPIMWIARNELRNVHEFEADHEVIIRGANIKNYQTTLLEMVLNETTPVVSGFNQSFIRRRFIEMRKSTAGTLGRIGKAISALSIAALFCIFTFTSCKSGNQPANGKNTDYQPGWFVIKGTVDPQISDSAYNVYLGDQYQHLSKEPDTSVAVTNKQWEYKLYLDAPRAGKIAAIFPGGSVCEATISFIAIPGDTLCLNVHNGFYDTQGTALSLYDHSNRAIKHMREATNGQTPNLPQIACEKQWTRVGQRKFTTQENYQTTQTLRVEQVYFTSQATVIKLMTDNGASNVNFDSGLCLKDPDGNTYKFQHATISDLSDNWGIEERVYGDLMYFDPMPANTESFSIIRQSDNTIYWDVVRDKSNDPIPSNNVLITATGDELEDWMYTIQKINLGSMETDKMVANTDGMYQLTMALEAEDDFFMNLRNIKTQKILSFSIRANDTISLDFSNGDYTIDGSNKIIKELGKVKKFYTQALQSKGADEAKIMCKEYLKESVDNIKENPERFSASFDYLINMERVFELNSNDDFQNLLDEIDPDGRIHQKSNGEWHQATQN